MISKASILTCDICKTKDIITEIGESDGWVDFFMSEIDEWRVKCKEPSQLCPACARKIQLVVADMVDETKN